MGALLARRHVGQANVTVISDGTMAMDLAELLAVDQAALRAAVPEATEGGRVERGFLVTHVRLGDASVLIDAGLGPPKPDWPVERTAGIEAGLAQIGESTEQVTHILFTHTHWDHADGALVERNGRREPRFTNARHLVGRADWEISQDSQHPWSPYLSPTVLAELDAAGRLEPVDGDHVVAPGITMLDAPGESPGHHAVLIESEGSSLLQVGDLYHHPCELTKGWFQDRIDAAACQRSRERLLAAAFRRDAVVVASHDVLPGWSKVVRVGGGYGVVPLEVA